MTSTIDHDSITTIVQSKMRRMRLHEHVHAEDITTEAVSKLLSLTEKKATGDKPLAYAAKAAHNVLIDALRLVERRLGNPPRTTSLDNIPEPTMPDGGCLVEALDELALRIKSLNALEDSLSDLLEDASRVLDEVEREKKQLRNMITQITGDSPKW